MKSSLVSSATEMLNGFTHICHLIWKNTNFNRERRMKKLKHRRAVSKCEDDS